MKKKVLVVMGILGMALAFTACGKGKVPAPNSERENIRAEKEETVKTKTPNAGSDTMSDLKDTPKNPDKDAGTVEEKSKLGYTMMYDPKLLTLDDTGEADVYTYQTTESLKAPVYFTIQSYKDMDADTLMDGLVLQNDQEKDDVEVTGFGADSIEGKQLRVDKDVNGVEQEQVFYVIPNGQGSLLVEIVGYEGMPQEAESAFEAMAGTFELLQK